MNKNQLYQQVILSHNKKPKNFGKICKATHIAEGHNPLCGDRFTIYMVIKEGIIDEISFDGEGCAISKASASMMTEALKGKTIEEAEKIFSNFHSLIVGDITDNSKISLGKLAIFSGVCQYPSRIKCASLSWHTMKKALITPCLEGECDETCPEHPNYKAK